jgi:hypothetical protein
MDQPSQNANPSGASSGQQQSGEGISRQQSQWSGGDRAPTAKVSELAGAAKETAQGLLDPLRDRALSLANEQKDSGLQHLDSVARAVQTAADEIGRDMPEAGEYVRQMAQGIERFSSNMRGKGFEELIGEVDSFARRQPLVFFGACIFAGFMATRFLKSSAEVRSSKQGAGDGLDPSRGEELGYGT